MKKKKKKGIYLFTTEMSYVFKKKSWDTLQLEVRNIQTIFP